MVLPGRCDPRGIHAAIWTEIEESTYQPPADKPLTLAAYVAGLLPSAYLEPTATGSVLPDMPLFLDAEWYVLAPLGRTDMAAYGEVPEFWRAVMEGR